CQSDRIGDTPLRVACVSGWDAVVRRLIQLGANVNTTSSGGYTPLMDTKDIEIMKILIAAGANINAVADIGDTALMGAIREDDYQRCEFLISMGVQRPRYVYQRKRNPDILNLIRNPLPLQRICAWHIFVAIK